MRESLGALREREFRLLFSGQLVSLLGDSFTSVALAFAVLAIGSPTALGVVFAAKSVPLVGFLLVGGVFADRLPRRTVMLTADAVRMACQAGTATLVLTHTAQVWQIAAIQAVSGTATAFFNPASTGLTPMTVSEERLQQANALRGISMSAAGLVGLTAGGLAVAAVGPGWALVADAASFGGSAFFLSRLRLPAHVGLEPRSFLADLAEGWREFTQRSWVVVVVLSASFGNAVWSFFTVLGAVVAKQSLGGPLAWATILAGSSVGALAGAAVALRLRPRHPLLFGSYFVGLLAVPLALLALRLPALVIAAGAVLGGAGNLVFNTFWETSLQRHVPPHALSRVSAYDWFGSLLFQPIGLAVAGPLAAGIGISNALWLAAATMVTTTAMCIATPSLRTLTL
ncbi:MAG TPA: MFS transporter [Gaiellaceae bacterium]|nr:MFS transporter [Gaiellaceae bacterium]